MPRRVWVTGGAGFIGSHVVEALLQAGYAVSVLDNLSSGHRENVPTEASFHLIDVRDGEALKGLLEKEPPWAICHLAAQVSVPISVRSPVHDAQVNILGTLRLLDLAREWGVHHFSFSSSCAVYGEPSTLPCVEDVVPDPLSPYGLSKRTAERYLAWYGESGGLRTLVFRYANVYGPRQGAEGEAGVVALFASQMLEGERPVIEGDGGQERDFVYVGDVARAHVLALEDVTTGLFNLGTGQGTSIEDLFGILRSLTDFPFDVGYGPPREGDIYRMILDPSRAARELGWEAEVQLSEGLRRTLAWYRAEEAG